MLVRCALRREGEPDGHAFCVGNDILPGTVRKRHNTLELKEKHANLVLTQIRFFGAIRPSPEVLQHPRIFRAYRQINNPSLRRSQDDVVPILNIHLPLIIREWSLGVFISAVP